MRQRRRARWVRGGERCTATAKHWIYNSKKSKGKQVSKDKKRHLPPNWETKLWFCLIDRIYKTISHSVTDEEFRLFLTAESLQWLNSPTPKSQRLNPTWSCRNITQTHAPVMWQHTRLWIFKTLTLFIARQHFCFSFFQYLSFSLFKYLILFYSWAPFTVHSCPSLLPVTMFVCRNLYLSWCFCFLGQVISGKEASHLSGTT